MSKEAVNHPEHYGGANNPYEAIKVIEAWQLNFCLGNTVKYISRAGKKDEVIQDLKKASWYLNREINKLEANMSNNTLEKLTITLSITFVKELEHNIENIQRLMLNENFFPPEKVTEILKKRDELLIRLMELTY